MLKEGDKVLRTDWLGDEKQYVCRSDEFVAESGAKVVFLENKGGYFATEFLKKTGGNSNG